MPSTARDLGAPNERTALAWQRTALSLMVASAVLARLTYGRLGILAVITTALAFAVSAWVFWESRGRYEHDAGIRVRSRSRGGRAGAALTLAVALIGVTELAALVVAR